jgi:hypothetical protein
METASKAGRSVRAGAGDWAKAIAPVRIRRGRMLLGMEDFSRGR